MTDTTTTTAELERLAAGLTDAQREAIIDCEWRGSGETQFALVDCVLGKLAPPLAHAFTLRWDRLTPVGLALRNHLRAIAATQEQPND